MADDQKKFEQPEVVAAVLDEVKKLGATSNENYSLLRTAHAQLAAAVDSLKGANPILDEKIARLSADVITRQEAMERAAAEQARSLDEFKVAWQRKGGGRPSIRDEEYKETYEWKCAIVAARRERTDREIVVTDDDVMALRAQKSGFLKYLRHDEKVVHRMWTEDEAKAMSVSSDPDGGYTVTPYMSARIATRLFEEDPIRQLASVETISTDALEMGADTQECGGGWIGEKEARSETSTPKLGQKRITTHEIYAEPQATQKLLEDSAINIEAWLANKVAQKFARLEGAAFVSGQGVSSPRGFLTYDDGTDWGEIEQVEMGAAATLTADGFINVMMSMQEPFIGRGTWLMNRTTVQAAMKLKDGDGQYLWQPGMTAGMPSTLRGMPVRMSTTMPVVAANALAVALADWKEAYLIVDRLGITTLRDPFSNKPFVIFYTRKRVGGDVVNYDAIKLGYVHV